MTRFPAPDLKTPCKCSDGARCPRYAQYDGYCGYCFRMFPCDHEQMDRTGRLIGGKIADASGEATP